MRLSTGLLLTGLLATTAAAVLTWQVLWYALRANLLDVPNHRSSHTAPTPRGGGLAIVAVFCLGLVVLVWLGLAPARLLISLVPSALLVALAGFIDDHGGLPPAVRLLAHFVAAFLFVAAIGGAPLLGIAWIDSWPWLATFLIAVALVWILNLFNFMDGIDAIAGVEVVFGSFALALLMWRTGASESVLLPAVLLGSASLGFLMWNWPPAKIFMGDVGSGFLGIALGMVALLAIKECGISVWAVVTLFGLFITDATLTLLRRAMRGETVYAAHRMHAYQRLSRRWNSHLKVVMASLAVNLLWLLPMGLLAQAVPAKSGAIAGIAYIPLICLVLWAGGGKAAESSSV